MMKVFVIKYRSGPVHRADNLTTICEPLVLTMWDP
jgi:hypothetical protein